MVAIIQNRDYRSGYREVPSDATDEILRIANEHIPKSRWRPAPLVIIGVKSDELNALLRTRKLPAVLNVGLFYSIHDEHGKGNHASYLTVVWLQDDFLPYMSASNLAAFGEVEWP